MATPSSATATIKRIRPDIDQPNILFAGILHGLDNPQLPLQEEVEGNGLEQEGLPFPIRQSDALWEFMQNDHLRERLGERFCHVFHACKHDELLQFERLITETEIEWMLKNA